MTQGRTIVTLSDILGIDVSEYTDEAKQAEMIKWAYTQALASTAATYNAPIAIEGDISGNSTFTGGTLDLDVVLSDNAVTLTKITKVDPHVILANKEATTGDVEAITVAQAKTLLNYESIDIEIIGASTFPGSNSTLAGYYAQVEVPGSTVPGYLKIYQ